MPLLAVDLVNDTLSQCHVSTDAALLRCKPTPADLAGESVSQLSEQNEGARASEGLESQGLLENPSKPRAWRRKRQRDVGPGREVGGLASLGSKEGPMPGRSPWATGTQNNYYYPTGVSLESQVRG